MFYYLYCVTNTVNNKVYVGVHKTDNLEDGYIGSGKIIRSAVKKYGLNKFNKEILFFFENEEEMYKKEREVVNEDFLSRPDVYNLRRGGTGGFERTEAVKGRAVTDNILKEKYGDDWRQVLAKMGNLQKNERSFAKFVKTMRDRYGDDAFKKFQGKKHNDTSKRKIGEANSKHQKGNGNSQYGTCWIWHELIGSKKCKKELLPEYIEQGWFKGRVLTLIR